jgi:fermentation-respiration switch protein FrsA (DUF1100 family)
MAEARRPLARDIGGTGAVMRDDLAEKFLYYPDPIPEGMPPPHWASGSLEVWITTSDGVRIHGLWWPEPEGRPVILFFHGNAQEVYSWSLVHRDLAELECRTLLVDYRGYGKSAGKPSERGLYADGLASLEWLHEEGVADRDVVMFGKSLGGAVACEVARGRDIRGLVLESTFTSLLSVARNLFPFAPGYRPAADVYASLEKMREIQCPVLVIHGDIDSLIPVSEGLELYDAANEPKELYIVEGAGHNDVSMLAGDEYGRRIRRWLDVIS